MRKRIGILSLTVLICWALVGTGPLRPGGPLAGPAAKAEPQYHPIVVSNMRNTISNIGVFGTRFGTRDPSSKPGAPPPGSARIRIPLSTCEWPAGSRNFYLNEGEVWVGAIAGGDTSVVTGRLSGQEWVPVENIALRTESEAFSDHDTYTRYDDGFVAEMDSPDHVPLGIRVTQITFAWTGSDHIVHALRVKNTGPADLDSVYVGFCWDFNVSSTAHGNPALGDLVGLDVDEEISFMYDQDGDNGLSPGYIGGNFLFRPLAGHSWWRAGQDPETDARRYALMSGGLMSDPTAVGDYRVLHTVGPFDLPSGRAIPVLHTLAIGEGLTGLKNAVSDARSKVGKFLADEGDSTLATGEEHIIPVSLNGGKRALGTVMFAVDWEFCDLDLYLVDPFGNRIDPQTAAGNPRFNYTSGPHHTSFLISDPQSGDWKMHIGYLSGPPSFSYHRAVTLFDVPYDYGLPMDYFETYWAYIHFGGRGETAQVDSFEISGDFQLVAGQYFDPSEDPVFVRIGPYTETIPESSFSPCPRKYDCYEYYGSPPGISSMFLTFYDGGKGAYGSFDVFANEVDMSAANLHSLVRLAIGQNTGFQRILFEDYGDEWWYSEEKGEKAAAGTILSPDLLPGAFTLSQNYPNPFNASTAIDYHLSRPAEVQLSLYNIRGQRVTVLAAGQQQAGEYRLIWDGTDSLGRPVGSGIYLCQLRADGLTRTRKMILLR